MPNEPQQTTFSNPEYDLLSTIYHSLKSSQTYASYVRDAQTTGDQDLANFFMQMQRQNDQCAQAARQFLSRPVNRSATPGMGAAPGMGTGTSTAPPGSNIPH